MRGANLQCEKWTVPMVRKHFEEHVSLVPRRQLGRDLRRLERVSSLLDRELSTSLEAALENDQSAELVDKKYLDKLEKVIKTKHAIIKDYRAFQKEDQMTCGINTLWKSVELGQTTAEEAKKLMQAAAAIQTAAGSGDMPTASELFN